MELVRQRELSDSAAVRSVHSVFTLKNTVTTSQQVPYLAFFMYTQYARPITTVATRSPTTTPTSILVWLPSSSWSVTEMCKKKKNQLQTRHAASHGVGTAAHCACISTEGRGERDHVQEMHQWVNTICSAHGYDSLNLGVNDKYCYFMSHFIKPARLWTMWTLGQDAGSSLLFLPSVFHWRKPTAWRFLFFFYPHSGT